MFKPFVISAFVSAALFSHTAAAQVTFAEFLTNYQLVSQQTAAGGKVFATYRADLVNVAGPMAVLPPGTSGPSGGFAPVIAQISTLDPFTLRLVPGQDMLVFLSVPPNSITHSSNTFTVIQDPTVPLDPNKLMVTFQNGPAAPVANPGPNQTVKAGTLVMLSAAGSSNPSGAGTGLRYFWIFISRPPLTMTKLFYDDTQQAMFVADVPGTYVLQLVVTNGVASSGSTVTVVATP